MNAVHNQSLQCAADHRWLKVLISILMAIALLGAGTGVASLMIYVQAINSRPVCDVPTNQVE